MKRTTTAALAIGTVLAVGALALPTLAQQAGHGHGGGSGEAVGEAGQAGRHGMMSPEMMQMMMGMRSGGGMVGGMMGDGMMSPEMMQMMSQMHGGGMGNMGMGGRGMGMMGQMADGADADADGIVSPDELRASLADRLTTFDTDGDGTLSLAEFEAMHAAMIRPMMVDRFQALDEDGDGRVTADEMTAPADQMQRMMHMRARIGVEHGQQGVGSTMSDN